MRRPFVSYRNAIRQRLVASGHKDKPIELNYTGKTKQQKKQRKTKTDEEKVRAHNTHSAARIMIKLRAEPIAANCRPYLWTRNRVIVRIREYRREKQ